MVITLNQYSKFFTPDTILGWIVAHKNVINTIFKYSDIVIRAPSRVLQMLVFNTITKCLEAFIAC